MVDIANIVNTYVFKWTAVGSYPGDRSWTLEDNGGNTILSVGTGNVSDQTVALNVGTNYVLQLADSYGDGWNGGEITLDVDLNGTFGDEPTGFSYTISDGASKTVNINIPLFFDENAVLKRSSDKSEDADINFSSFKSDILLESSNLNYTGSKLNLFSTVIYEGTLAENETLKQINK